MSCVVLKISAETELRLLLAPRALSRSLLREHGGGLCARPDRVVEPAIDPRGSSAEVETKLGGVAALAMMRSSSGSMVVPSAPQPIASLRARSSRFSTTSQETLAKKASMYFA